MAEPNTDEVALPIDRLITLTSDTAVALQSIAATLAKTESRIEVIEKAVHSREEREKKDAKEAAKEAAARIGLLRSLADPRYIAQLILLVGAITGVGMCQNATVTLPAGVSRTAPALTEEPAADVTP